MYTKTDVQPVGNFWENDERPEFLLFFLAQSGPKIGPLRPIFSTHIKVLGMSMWSNTVVKPLKTFWEITKHQKFVLLWVPKWPRNWAFEAHILHISEGSSNAHIKQDWCESRPNFSKKYSKTWILTHLEAQNGPKFGPLVPLFYTPTKVSPMSF